MGTTRPGFHAAPSVGVAGALGAHRQEYLSATSNHKQGEVHVAF